MSEFPVQDIINDWSSHVFGLGKLYDIELNYKEDSVAKIEQLCEIIFQQVVSNPGTKEENIDKASKMIGSFLGELIIKNVGGEWHINSNNVMAVRFKKFECYPINKVYKRLKNGKDDGIEFYYKVCKMQMNLQM